MTLNHRRARPLTRDTVSLRDDRLFIVACDDTFAPKQYFDFFRLPRVQVHVIQTPDGRCAATDVLNRLLGFEHAEDDELWMLLDADHYVQGTHLQSFVEALNEAARHGVSVAISKPSFELWLLLHHVEEGAVDDLPNAKAVTRELRKKLGEYNKTRLKQEHYPVSTVCDAHMRAKRLDATVKGGEIPQRNTTRVYRLWEAIVAKALPSQLPVELHSLLPKQRRRS